MQKHIPHFFTTLHIWGGIFINKPLKHIILAGVQGGGKSYYGKKVAQEVGVPFFDVDRGIEEAYHAITGKSITCKRLMQKGEAYFRYWEQCIIQNIPTYPPIVIALGGGTLLHPANRGILQSLGMIIVLDMEKSLWKCNTQWVRPYGNVWERAFERRIKAFRKVSCTWLNVCGLQFYSLLKEIIAHHT